MRRTKVAQIYKKTGNLRAVQLLLGHTKLEARCVILASKSMTRLVYPSKSNSDQTRELPRLSWGRSRPETRPEQ
jgi:hypothetical protein